MLCNEKLGSSSNVKSKATRQSIQVALESAIQILRKYKTIPENGLIIYSGTVQCKSKNIISKQITKEIIPPNPVKSQIYYCSKIFDTSVLEELVESGPKYGFVVVSGEETILATLQGSTVKILSKLHERLPKHQKKGGQSAPRFQRKRLNEIHAYLKRISEKITDIYLVDHKSIVEKIIIGGPADLRDHLLEMKFNNNIPIHHSSISLAYTGKNGLHSLISASSDILSDHVYEKEQSILINYFNMIDTNYDMIRIGYANTLEQLQSNTVKQLIVSSESTYLNELMESYPDIIEIVSSDTPQGQQFIEFSGIGCILYYGIVN